VHQRGRLRRQDEGGGQREQEAGPDQRHRASG
jgi:hypothetical protein